MVANTSTSITASWQLPPENARNGIISGFKLFYKLNGSSASPTVIHIVGANLTNLTRIDVTGLQTYTEYEFQVLAFTSVGDGPKSSVKVARTLEDGKNVQSKKYHVSQLYLQLSSRTIFHLGLQCWPILDERVMRFLISKRTSKNACLF